MAASGFTPISLYYSTTASAAPTAGNLVNGELAINITDGKLYYKDNGGVVRLLADRNASAPVTSISFGTTGLTPSTSTSGAVTVAGTLAIANGGTGATSAANARTNLGATTVGANLFTLTNPSAITFPRFNADNTVSALNATSFRTAIGAGTGSGTVTGVTATSPVASSGGTAPVISLSSAYGDTLNPYGSKTANFFLAAPNGTAGVPTFRAIVAADIPTLNQNTTGTAANVTGTVAIANGGTGETTRQAAMDALAGAVTSGQYLRGNGTDVVMSAIQAADVPTLNQNTTGTASNVTGTVAIANGGTGQTTASAAFNALSPITSTGDLIIGNGVNSATRLAIGSNGQVLTSNGTTATWAAAGASLSGVTNSDFPYQTSLGYQAGNLNTGSGGNTHVGYQTGTSNTDGTSNSAFGMMALFSTTTGGGNTAVGRNALFANTTGENSVAVGLEALRFSNAGNTVAVGYQALYNNTTGVNNTAVGTRSLDANTNGVSNSALGNNALGANTTGSYNSGFGTQALLSTSTGSYNTGLGYYALGTNTTGQNNVAIGALAMASASTPGSCTAIGVSSLESVSTGLLNTAIGYSSGALITSGSKNSILGSYTGNSGGLDIRTSSNNIVLSDGDGNPRVWWDNLGNMRIPKAVRATITTDNDLSFDMNAASNFKSTPTAGGALTFTNITEGQTGNIILVNGSNYAITAAATTKVSATCLATISATGTYWLSYYSDGTNVYVANTGALA